MKWPSSLPHKFWILLATSERTIWFTETWSQLISFLTKTGKSCLLTLAPAKPWSTAELPQTQVCPTSALFLETQIYPLFQASQDMGVSQLKIVTEVAKRVLMNSLDLSNISLQRCLRVDLLHSLLTSGLSVLWSTNSSSEKHLSEVVIRMVLLKILRSVKLLLIKIYQNKQKILSQSFWLRSQSRD